MQEERYVVAVDFGSSKISLSVSEVSAGSPKLLFFESRDSEGVTRGKVSNPKKATEPLMELISKAQSELNISIDQAVVAMPRWKIRSTVFEKQIERSNASEFIDRDEVTQLKEMVVDDVKNGLNPNEALYDIMALSFSTDDLYQVSENDVLGAVGSSLGGKFIAFCGPQNGVSNIDRVFNECNLGLVRNYFTPGIVSKHILSADEKELGVALVEIGAAVSSVSIYHKGAIRYYNSFPFGGKSVTFDIRTECNIDFNLAENIKRGFGSCMSERLCTLNDKILQINNPRSSEKQQLPVKYLSEIIGCRMKEIVDACMHLICESGYKDKLRYGIVLCGGAAETLNLVNLFSSMSGLQCRVGTPYLTGLCSEASQEAMILAAARNKNINCAGPVVEESEEQTETLQEEQEDGSLFSKNELEEIEVNSKKQKEKPKEPKQKKKKIKLLDNLVSLFDNTYNEMGKE